MTLATAALAAFGLAGLAGLGAMAARDGRAAREERGRLLDALAPALAEPRLSVAADGFPVLEGRLADGRAVRIGLVPDTLVTRRLPQLWLVVSIEDGALCRPSLGALARPTGAEFYSRVSGLPERLEAPEGAALLVRGDAALRPLPERVAECLRGLFAEPRLKEVVAKASGARVVFQAGQGDRASHLLLRQARFPAAPVEPAALRACVAAADGLLAALDGALP